MNLSGTDEEAKNENRKKEQILYYFSNISGKIRTKQRRFLLQSAQLYNRAEPGKPERGNVFRSDIFKYISQRINFSEPTFLIHHWIELEILILKHD